MNEPGARVRLFAALDVPEEVRGALARWAREQAGGIAGLRLLAPETLHVTLCFLGWRETAAVEGIGELVAGCAAPVPGLALATPAWFAPRRPRVLVVEVADRTGALRSLQGRLSGALAAGAGYEPERRPFRPHVTVARVGARARVRPVQLAAPEPLRFDGAAVTLYRSRPGRGGARYEPLRRVAV